MQHGKDCPLDKAHPLACSSIPSAPSWKPGQQCIWTVVTLTIGLAVGCARPESNVPETYPVVGTVLDASDQPVSGGAIEFVSVANQELLAVSNIAEDGSFELSTFLNGESAPGAVQGEHQVTVHMPQLEHGDSMSILLPQPLNVEPEPNDLEIQLPKLKTKRRK